MAILFVTALFVYWNGLPDDHIPLYVMAVDNSVGGEGSNIRVDIRINDEIRFRSIRGDSIPYIHVSPGDYLLRCTAPGYDDYTESIRISHSDSEAYAYCEMRKRAGKPAHERKATNAIENRP